MPQNSSQPNRRASSARSGGSARPARSGGSGQGSRGGTGRPTSRGGGVREVGRRWRRRRGAASGQECRHAKRRAESGEKRVGEHGRGRPHWRLQPLKQHPGHGTERGSVTATLDRKEGRSDGPSPVNRHTGRRAQDGSGSLEFPQDIRPEDVSPQGGSAEVGSPKGGSRPVGPAEHRRAAPDAHLT